MRSLLIAALMLLTMQSTVAARPVKGPNRIEGYAAHYRVGVMERVAHNRGMPVSRCMLATSYYPLGTWLLVTSKVTNAVLSCRVTDITARRHVKAVRGRGIVAEFGAANIGEMCGLKRVGERPPRDCPVILELE